MYLKLLRKVGDFEIECFTPEESQTIQELLFILDTLPSWANVEGNKDSKYVNLFEQFSTGSRAFINESEYVKKFQKQSESKIITGNLIIGTGTHVDGKHTFYYVESAKNGARLFNAIEKDDSFLTVYVFHDGNWANYLRYIFIEMSSGQNEAIISKKSPPWNFQPF